MSVSAAELNKLSRRASKINKRRQRHLLSPLLNSIHIRTAYITALIMRETQKATEKGGDLAAVIKASLKARCLLTSSALQKMCENRQAASIVS